MHVFLYSVTKAKETSEKAKKSAKELVHHDPRARQSMIRLSWASNYAMRARGMRHEALQSISLKPGDLSN